VSDDTPTQRFPTPDGDAPTQRLETAELREDLHEQETRSRGLLVGLIIAGALLLVAIVVLIVFLLGRSSGQPQAGDTATPAPSETSATPSPTPSETATTLPPPPAPLAIDSFASDPATVFCNTSDSPGVNNNQYISFSWRTTSADTVALGAYDPYGDYAIMYVNLPVNGSTDDAGLQQITFNCPEESQVWRLEASGDGQTVTQDITIVNTGDTQ
jgi:hypothetical protein